jgi:DNA replication protein DnaC
MLIQQTLTQLKHLKLTGMAAALERQATLPNMQALSFDERLGSLVDEEMNYRENRKLARILREAKLKFPAACVEAIDFRGQRGLDQSQVNGLTSCDWIRHHQNLLLTGASGCGKTWLACAFGNQAARKGFTVLYRRMPRLLESLEVAHGDGSLPKLRLQLERASLLILDDWGLTPMGPMARHDLLEIIDDRIGVASTIITSQLPLDAWHSYIGDPTFGDAIMDRLVHSAHQLPLKGESLRKMKKE